MRNLSMTAPESNWITGTRSAPSRLASGEKVLKKSVTQKEKSKDICIEGYPEKYHLLLFLHIHNQCTTTTPKFTLHSVLFCLI